MAGFTREAGSYWGSNPLKLHSEYLGLPVVALAVLGTSRARRGPDAPAGLAGGSGRDRGPSLAGVIGAMAVTLRRIGSEKVCIENLNDS